MSLVGTPRATCYRCRKPARLCVCARVPELSHRTRLLVLQHHRERFHPVGTARLARLGLADAEVREVAGPLPRPALHPSAALLFPGPRARDLAALPPDERPAQLVVLDGTWRQARQIFRENAWVRALPQVAFTPSAPSRYRIRKQPAPHCLSTIEAILEALRLLEPDAAEFERLRDAFDALIDDQAAFMLRGGDAPRHQRRRPRPSRAVPTELLDRPGDLLLVYGETAPLVPARADRARQLVRWSAWRPARGECFDALVQPEGAPPPAAQLAPMGLTPADLARARPLPAVGAAFRAFLRPQDLVTSWHPAVLRMHAWLDPAPPAGRALKTLWSNLRNRSPGGLEDFVAREGLAGPLAPFDGRAGRRLTAAALAATELLRVAPRMARVEGGAEAGEAAEVGDECAHNASPSARLEPADGRATDLPRD